ncbi:MAG: hypothetical protein HY808_04200 [Nitrospirae bacterium]|nr:hypothetical protein [Nitrospirota bacterium]
MKLSVLIVTILILISTLNVWGKQVRPLQKNKARDIQNVMDERTVWIKGTMTKITKVSAVIEGREYSLTRETIIKYEDGEIIQDIRVFRATESAKVNALVERSVVKTLVIEEVRLRN